MADTHTHAQGEHDSPTAVFTVLAGPWGPIHIAATQHGIVALEHVAPDAAFALTLERRLHGRVVPVDQAVRISGDGPAAMSARLTEAVERVHAFLAGRLDSLDALEVDLGDRPAWDRTVLAAVRDIRPGTTASYADVARAISRRGAARAVGGAVGRNPIGLVIPCHRVIASDGSLGGYGGGWWGSREERLGIKRELLAREGVDVSPAKASTSEATFSG